MSTAERAAASDQICRALLATDYFREADVLAAYLPFGAEASPLAAIESAITAKTTVCVPVIRSTNPPEMQFVRLHSLSGLRKNDFGILEPDASPDDYVDAHEPDLVLVPLVGFDASGNRLGMGGGFYDRCFSFVPGADSASRPVLCGIAFECQRVPELEASEWDVPLDCVATESGITTFNVD